MIRHTLYWVDYAALALALVGAVAGVLALRHTIARVADFDSLRSLDRRLAEVEATLADYVERYTLHMQRERMASARGRLKGLREQRDAAIDDALAIVQATATPAAPAAPPENRAEKLMRLRREVLARRAAH